MSGVKNLVQSENEGLAQVTNENLCEEGESKPQASENK